MITNKVRFAFIVLLLFTFSCNEDDALGSDVDVYVAGKQFDGNKFVAKLWKNGEEALVTDGSTDADANSIFVVAN